VYIQQPHNGIRLPESITQPISINYRCWY